MGALVLTGDTSGSVTVNVPTVAGTNTATFPAATGTVMVSGNQPAFSAYLSATQTITSGVATKIQCNTKEFDTNSNYDNATNYRFTPTVAGYYQVNARTDNGASTGGSQCTAYIYKNGSVFKAGVAFGLTAAQFTEGASVSCLVFCNGSTDYIEFYTNITATSAVISSGLSNTYFQACLIRGA
jgi:hypothetical protein